MKLERAIPLATQALAEARDAKRKQSEAARADGYEYAADAMESRANKIHEAITALEILHASITRE